MSLAPVAAPPCGHVRPGADPGWVCVSGSHPTNPNAHYYVKASTMTDQQTAEPPLHVVQAAQSARLAQLHAAYADAKAANDAAAEQLKAITDAIKLELTQAAPEGYTRIGLDGPDGPPLRLTYAESWRVDSRKLKAEDPETYVRYAKKSGSWTLKAAGGAQ